MASEETDVINIPPELSDTEFTKMISIDIICRLCANQSDKLIGIYSEEGVNNDLAEKMNVYLPIKVADSDNLPLQCCWQCASTVLAWHDLVVTSVEADRRLRTYQFVTEKQLEDISSSYGGNENILSATVDENLEHKKEKSTPTDFTRRKQLSPSQDEISKARYSENNVITEGNAIEDSSVTADVCDPEETEKKSVNTPDNNPSVETKATENKVYLFYKDCANLNTLTCNICKRKLNSIIRLNAHLKSVHFIKVPKLRRKKCDIVSNFKCSWCEKSYTKSHDLDRHLKNKHGQTVCSKRGRPEHKVILKSCRISTAEENGLLYKCDICPKYFKKSWNLLRHRTIHTNQKQYCCHFCRKSFRLNMSLARHIREVHNDIRKFKCEVCTRVFKNKWSRDEHQNIHTNSRPYICDVCGKSFRQSASLYVHKQYHSKEYPFECNCCQKKFPRKHNLEKHCLSHTGEKSHGCQDCDATFATKQALNRHKKCHNPVVCDKCGSGFQQSRYLKLHRTSCRQSLENFEARSQDNIVNNSDGVIIRNDGFCSQVP